MLSCRPDWPGFWRSVVSTSSVASLDLLTGPDKAIWDHAERHGMTLITIDSDFAELSDRFVEGPAVVLVRIGNSTNRELRRRLGSVLTDIVDALATSERLVEVR
jgi:predicted nuclease of predicted toxin-antitoxin system